jgi:biopolymer transport protein ExbD/biopolymer transport protein TolR
MAGAVGVGKGPRSDINITPLVDIVLVLLIIFMVLTPLMEKEIAVRVPEEQTEPVPPPPPDEKVDQYIFRVDDKGQFFINSEQLTDENAADRLKVYYRQAKSNEAKNGPPVIFFEADDKTKYVRAIKGLDKIKDSSAGWTIGMMTEKIGAPAAPGAPGAPTPGGAPAPGGAEGAPPAPGAPQAAPAPATPK